MKNQSAPEAIEVLKVLFPSLLTLLGVATFNGVAAADIRDRYQTAADLLVYTSLLCIIAAMIAATYPFTIQRPLARVWRFLSAYFHRRRQKRDFDGWIRHWAEFTHLMFEATDHRKEKPDGWWDQADARYSRLRSWFIEHEGAYDDSLDIIHRTLSAQWARQTQMESNLQRHGFFSLYREQDTLRNAVEMQIDSDIGRDGRGHHPQHTLTGIWDGLTRYSVAKGWGAIKPWREITNSSEHAGDAAVEADEPVVESTN